MWKIFFFASLKSLKTGVGSGVGAGSWCVSQRYKSTDPNPHQNATDPQHCSKCLKIPPGLGVKSTGNKLKRING